jgi:hypothetical protein
MQWVHHAGWQVCMLGFGRRVCASLMRGDTLLLPVSHAQNCFPQSPRDTGCLLALVQCSSASTFAPIHSPTAVRRAQNMFAGTLLSPSSASAMDTDWTPEPPTVFAYAPLRNTPPFTEPWHYGFGHWMECRNTSGAGWQARCNRRCEQSSPGKLCSSVGCAPRRVCVLGGRATQAPAPAPFPPQGCLVSTRTWTAAPRPTSPMAPPCTGTGRCWRSPTELRTNLWPSATPCGLQFEPPLRLQQRPRQARHQLAPRRQRRRPRPPPPRVHLQRPPRRCRPPQRRRCPLWGRQRHL